MKRFFIALYALIFGATAAGFTGSLTFGSIIAGATLASSFLPTPSGVLGSGTLGATEQKLKYLLDAQGDLIDDKIKDANAALKGSFEDRYKALKGEIETEISAYTEKFSNIETANEDLKKELSDIQAKVKKGALSQGGSIKQTVSGLFAKTIEDNLEAYNRLKSNEGKGRRAEMELKAVSESTSLTGRVINYDTVSDIVFKNDRVEHVRNFLPGGTTNGPSVRFPVELAYTSNGDFVTENQKATKDTVTLKEETFDVKRVAFSMDVSNSLLEDMPAFTSYISLRLPTKYMLKEDSGVLFGDGIGANIKGITTYAGAAYADGGKIVPNAQIYDLLRLQALNIRQEEYLASAIMLNPSTVADMDLAKNANGDYIVPMYIMNGGRRQVVGIPVIETTAIPVNASLVGDFAQGAQRFERRGLTLEFSRENNDNIETDVTTIALSSRFALPVYRDFAFDYCDDIAAAITGLAT